MVFVGFFQDTPPLDDVIVVYRLKTVSGYRLLNWMLMWIVFVITAHCLFATDVFICGGYNGELILDDLWKINLQTFQWSKLPAVMPEPAYFHCAAVTPVS